MRALILVLFLSGCFASDPPLPPEGHTVDIDIQYLQECAPLNPLPLDASFRDLLTITADNTIIYSECKNKQSNSIKLIKELGNIK